MKTGVRRPARCIFSMKLRLDPESEKIITIILIPSLRTGSEIMHAGCRSEIIRLNLIWIIPAKGLMRFLSSFSFVHRGTWHTDWVAALA